MMDDIIATWVESSDEELDKNSCEFIEPECQLHAISSGDEDEFVDEDEDDEDEDQNDSQQLCVLTAEDNWDDGPILFKEFGFEEDVGLKVDLLSSYEPYDFFRLLVTDDLLKLIVDETNAYAAQNMENFPRLMKGWTNLDKEELLCFLALFFAMGLIRMPEIKNYWRKDILYRHPFFSTVMGRDRFLQILSNIYFVNNETADKSEKLWKCKPVIDHFNERMHQVNVPQRNLSIDESMMLFRGPLGLRQCRKSNGHKFGIKFYMLCQPNGLAQRIIVYGGKGTLEGPHGHTFEVVSRLMENYSGKGYSLYMNDYYSSVELSSRMLQEKTHTTATFSKKRKGNSRDVAHARLKKGQSKWKHWDGIIQLKWKDTREVLAMSTEHDPAVQTLINSRGVEKMKPKMLVQHGMFMSGIDRVDQFLSYHEALRKTRKWYRKVALRIMQLFLGNACVLHNTVAETKINLTRFQEIVVRKLLEEAQRNFEVRTEDKRKDHFPAQFPPRPSGDATRRRCRFCSQNNKYQRTLYYCMGCDDKPPLCVLCFSLYKHDGSRVGEDGSCAQEAGEDLVEILCMKEEEDTATTAIRVEPSIGLVPTRRPLQVNERETKVRSRNRRCPPPRTKEQEEKTPLAPAQGMKRKLGRSREESKENT